MADKNDRHLLSSVHSAVTPRQQHTSTHPNVSRQQSRKKSVHRRKRRNSTRSITIIHTKIRPQSNSTSKNRSKSVNNLDTFPSITDLINGNQRRKRSLNEDLNNTTQPSDLNSEHRAGSRLADDRRQVKTSGRLNTHGHRVKKRLSKSSRVVPNDVIQYKSSSFDIHSSSKTTDGWSVRKLSTDDLRDINEHTKKRKKTKRFYCSFCPCSSVCLIGLILLGLFLGLLLAVLLLEFLSKTTTTTKTTTMHTSILSTNTSTTITTTTTTHLVCGASCVNQSWISTNNLLAKWEFDNDLLEDVSNYNATSAQTPTYVTGYVNQALLFSASTGQVLSSSSISLMATSFTVDAWIYLTSFPNTKDHSIVGLCPKNLIYECLYLTIRESGGSYYLFFGFFGDDCLGSTLISINEWIHIAFVFETNVPTQSIYLNGKLDATRTAGGTFQASSDPVTIGEVPIINVISGSDYFDGIIDRLAISDRDKSSCEILEEATLAAYFSFDSPVSLTDLGPNSLSAVAQSVSFVSTGHSFQAISFSGSNSSYFQVQGLTGLGITDRPFSISFWVRPQSLSGTLVHVSATASGLGWCIPYLGFAANGSIIAQILSGAAVQSVSGPAIPLAPVWTHIVQTWGPGSGLRLYVDNVLVASNTATANSYTGSTVPTYVTLANTLSGIGVCNPGGLGSKSPFTGDIDELMIYSRTLTTDDICTLYTR